MRERLLAAEKVTSIKWCDGILHLLDQRSLPFETRWLPLASAAAVAGAIRDEVVQGAPAVGIAAAYGIVLGLRARLGVDDDWERALEEDFEALAETQPAAVNLAWALNRMRDRLLRVRESEDVLSIMQAEAIAIHDSDREANLTMAQFGADLIRKHQGSEQTLLTHGSAGALATGGFGTALGVIRAAYLEGMVERVYADETRPGLQGTRLAAWELAADGIPVTVSADSAAAHLMKTKGITWVIVGAEHITANGDVVNRIGTYQLAVTAMHHGVRFMVVAPSSSIDLNLASGEDVYIEEGAARDLLALSGQHLGAGVDGVNPVFDVTPADLIDVIVTEKGIVERPDTAKLAQLMCRKRLH
ncbi:MAG TPA: S-methyl-5-thioribose-1-phosphate isomerase [Pseudomonas sp.]|uniref:S-methyl-5-thioribose-1-phosphate isomerase n=1 Tax=Pseudomonas sp. TaxID=306 RepID=UPI002B493D61|nr:S-methyl-5-thioribose-1-phosphate isomerase [Pseudomonas sp.]HKS11976.1 S-methyl-5-thioribose-1-phosphate isomerase [Pseudomonas sp.]